MSGEIQTEMDAVAARAGGQPLPAFAPLPLSWTRSKEVLEGAEATVPTGIQRGDTAAEYRSGAAKSGHQRGPTAPTGYACPQCWSSTRTQKQQQQAAQAQAQVAQHHDAQSGAE